MNRIRSTLVAGVSLGVVLSVILTFVNLYSQRSGIVLPNGKIAGGDFVCFHMAGNLIRDGRVSPYDFTGMFETQRLLFSGTSDAGSVLAFVYPPLVGHFFSLFSYLDLVTAYYVWLGCSVLLAALAIFLVLRTFGWRTEDQSIAFLSAFAFSPLAIYNFAGGQTASFGLLIVALLFVCLRLKREFVAGLLFSLSYYKPSLFLVFLFIMLIEFRLRFLAGFLLGAILILSAALYTVGVPEFVYYVKQLWEYNSGQGFSVGNPLADTRGVALMYLLSSIFGQQGGVVWSIYLFFAVSLISWLWAVTREINRASGGGGVFHPYLFATQMSLSLFLSLHYVNYDSSLLLIPFGIFLAYGRGALGTFGFSLGLLVIALFYLELFVTEISFGGIALSTLGVLQAIWVVLLLKGLTQVSVRARAAVATVR